MITIDDGFDAVGSTAVPILRRHGYPATVYVTSFYVKHDSPVFRLAIQYMFWKTVKRVADFSGAGWNTCGVVDISIHEDMERLQEECTIFSEKAASEEVRRFLCEQPGRILDVPYAAICGSRILHLMRPEHVATLAESRVDVALHTHRHRFPSDDRTSAMREILDNRNALTRWTGREPSHFCYPSGMWSEVQWQ